jgi:hypothetical protein
MNNDEAAISGSLPEAIWFLDKTGLVGPILNALTPEGFITFSPIPEPLDSDLSEYAER